MAGKRQHYLPRFLLKGFASRIKGEKVFTWYFRKEAEPMQVSTRDIGRTKFFYSERGDSRLDDLIKKKENTFGALLNRIRQDKKILSTDQDSLAELIVHLVTRTKHTRSGFTKAVDDFIDMMSRNLSDPQQLARQIKKSPKNDNKKFRDNARKGIREAMGFKNPLVEEQIIQYVEKNMEKIADIVAEPYSQTIEKEFSKTKQNVEKHGTRSHKEMIRISIENKRRMERLGMLKNSRGELRNSLLDH